MKIHYFTPDTVSLEGSNIRLAHPEHTRVHNHVRKGLIIVGQDSRSVSMTFEHEPALRFDISHVRLVELLVGHTTALKDVEVQWVYDCTAKQLKLINLATFKHATTTAAGLQELEDVPIKTHPSQFKVGYAYHPAGKPKTIYWCTFSSDTHAVLIPKDNGKEPYVKVYADRPDRLYILQMVEKGQVPDYDKEILTKLTGYAYCSAYLKHEGHPHNRAKLSSEVNTTWQNVCIPFVELFNNNLLSPWLLNEYSGSATSPLDTYLFSPNVLIPLAGSMVRVAGFSLQFTYDPLTYKAVAHIQAEASGSGLDPTKEATKALSFEGKSRKEALTETVKEVLSLIREVVKLPSSSLPDELIYGNARLYEIPCDMLEFTSLQHFTKHTNQNGIQTYLIPIL